jgi:hypothetical protein
MATKLEGPLRRELAIAGKPYMLTITPEGFRHASLNVSRKRSARSDASATRRTRRRSS